jgi:hypothetical protein
VTALAGCRPGPPGDAAEPTPGETLHITGGRWLDVETGQLVANGGILIRDGAFASLDAGVRPPAGARVLELDADHTILPGMFDLHAHYAVDLFGEGRVDEMTAYPALFLANGVTSTFPAGEMDPQRLMARGVGRNGDDAGFHPRRGRLLGRAGSSWVQGEESAGRGPGVADRGRA